MRRDQLNDEYLELLDKQRLYFKTVKDFKEVIFSVGSWSVCWYKITWGETIQSSWCWNGHQMLKVFYYCSGVFSES